MRYLGNKESIVSEIKILLDDLNLLNENYIFFDAFCGAGSVANSLKDNYKIILNDNLKLAVTYSTGRILKGHCSFNKLGFDPITFLNSSSDTFEGFISKNYSPKLSGRMYFSDANSGRIDYFRKQIDDWFSDYLIDENERDYLLACLLESVSKVANVAGVYGAYLKHWDPRALKKIRFIEVEGSQANSKPNLLKACNQNLIELIENTESDILYLDPPYTNNKYSVQFHVLETLIRGDMPVLKGKTGARDNSKISDNWSKKHIVEMEFEETIAKSKSKHILVSYSSDGLMNQEFITNVLKRYGESNTFILKKIPYKKYRNYKTNSSKNDHFEYLFYIKRKAREDVIYYSPLNYMGGKANLIESLQIHFNGKDKFIDLMSGGFNVGINVSGFSKVIYNDNNHFVKNIIEMFYKLDSATIIKKVEQIIRKYKLIQNDKQQFMALREDYNNHLFKKTDHAIYLYTLILYGFQQQIRFNSRYKYNNTVGESGFNESIREKIVSFSRKIKEINVEFLSLDYEELFEIIDHDTLVYIDPPYLVTLGSYNDGKRGFNGWNKDEEERLITFLDRLKLKGCKLIISNVLDYKDRENKILKKWILENDASLSKRLIRGREEVIIKYEGQI